MSTLSSFLPPFRMPKSLQTGLGKVYTNHLLNVEAYPYHRRTKKKDIYVISTVQRPVPLEHYLYAGRDKFKIVDAKRNFIGQG